ncbi:hypothetical protein SAY87_015923 [Trapa incisa]|uniref:Uncharacterized protein n=1 Tax=Trapa incisa TaxID=236973 RepID=A0AAN7L533_9MYRT|nr:hypothetical protein SAY87_015923 [Trapa incisa]
MGAQSLFRPHGYPVMAVPYAVSAPPPPPTYEEIPPLGYPSVGFQPQNPDLGNRGEPLGYPSVEEPDDHLGAVPPPPEPALMNRIHPNTTHANQNCE